MPLRLSTELLSDIVEEAAGHARRKPDDHPITVDSGEELLLVDADARLVVQVIVNLIDNAIKYTPAGTPIDITVGREGDLAAVRVADQGPGVPDGEKEHIFDMFYTGARTVQDNRRSLGLGLYLCRSIVEAHGGVLCLEDNKPHGAVFRFTLPLKEVPLDE